MLKRKNKTRFKQEKRRRESLLKLKGKSQNQESKLKEKLLGFLKSKNN